MDTNTKTIEQLNNLICIAADGQKGYDHAAKHVQDPVLKRDFERFSQQRADYVRQLKQEVDALGGSAEDPDGEILGALHRTWMDLKASLTSGDKDAIINACITGEEAALDNYAEALSEPYITGQTHSVILQQQQGIQAALDHIRTHCGQSVATEV